MRSAWLLAARPRTLWAAVGPVLVGAGIAWGDGVFRSGPFVAALVGGVAIQVAANFANDVSDARQGADPPHRLGPPRAVASGLLSPAAVWRGTWAAFAVAAAAGVYLTIVAGWVVVPVGLASILATLGYTGGPRPYGYRGLGELAVFLFFGLIATVMSRYVHDRSAPPEAWLLAVPVGLLATAILVANNVRDATTDAAAGKRTLAVMLGHPRTVTLFASLVVGAFVTTALFAAVGWTSPGTSAALVALPFAIPLVGQVRRQMGAGLVGTLEGTARLHALVSALIAGGAAFT